VTDLVARLGGDEFALLLPETDGDAARFVTDKLRGALLRSMWERNWPVTFSIGMVSFAVPPASVEEMVRMADEAMYLAKQGGKNSIAVSEAAV
jgi:diguanylate cyclase (GGDEF)-like protein